MTFIFDLPNEQLLPYTFDLAEDIEKLVNVSGIMEERKAPEGDETKRQAAKKNARKMLRKLCKEFPKETGEILDRLWVVDDGEKIPNILVTVPIVLARKDAMGFFTSLLNLTQ